ncbi:MAG: CPBP family intramembrane metalloprotease [Chitinophagaceae bacterium]|nr:CPBP family intramembrane metalloprotease [Chitinophagaceae bacterium]
MTFCPLIAAAILVYKKQKKTGVKQLLKLSFDFKKIKDKRWYLPVVLLMPVIALLSFWYMKITGEIVPEPQPSPISVAIFFVVYFIGAIGEELGWSGYITEPLQNSYGALKASLAMGIIWAGWHIIPWSQAHQTTTWIVWQCIGTVFLRVVMVWLFNNTAKSVFVMILFHTMINISPYLVPNYGSHYNPFILAVLLIITTVAITFLWGTKTLADYKYASNKINTK